MEDVYVSVIIPVYNATDTLDACLASLARQSYGFLELIFVNDCSRDNSLQVLTDFAKSLEQRETVSVRVISHDFNKGVAAARNTGLELATGDYIYYVDADDWLDADAIERLMKEVERTGADIVGFDWYLSFAKRQRLMRQPPFCSAEDAITKMLNGQMRWNLWLFVVKRSLYEEHGIRFLPGMNMGEDMMVMFKLFSVADKVVHVDRALYHYGQSNTASLTKVYSDKHIEEVTENLKEVIRFYSIGVYAEHMDERVDVLKLNIKLPLLISDRPDRYQKWRNWFSESNRYVWHNKVQSLRIRLLQWAAWKRQFWIVKMHYYLIIRVLYGVIYK